MWDAQIAELAGRQFNRISRSQLLRLGGTEAGIAHRVATGRLIAVEQGVFAIAPVLDDDWGRWMGATLTAPRTVLSHMSAAVAWGLLSVTRDFECVTRPGSGGPRRHGGILAYRSSTLAGDVITHRGIPISSVPRTLLDLARTVGDRALARAVREAVRLERTSLAVIGDRLGDYRGRRGSRRLAETLARYAGLPLERARSGAEIRAMEILRDAGRPLPNLNRRIAGEEADLSCRGSGSSSRSTGDRFISMSGRTRERNGPGRAPDGASAGSHRTTSTSSPSGYFACHPTSRRTPYSDHEGTFGAGPRCDRP